MPCPCPSRPRSRSAEETGQGPARRLRAGDAEVAFLAARAQSRAPGFDCRGRAPTRRCPQLVTARRRYGFPSWRGCGRRSKLANLAFAERRGLFVRAATDESTGAVDAPFRQAKRLLERDPTLARADVLERPGPGRRLYGGPANRGGASVGGGEGGPQERQPLHYVTYSKFHRESPEIAQGSWRPPGFSSTTRRSGRLIVRPRTPGRRTPCTRSSAPVGWPTFPPWPSCSRSRRDDRRQRIALPRDRARPTPAALALLLARGANPRGTNALHHAFDRRAHWAWSGPRCSSKQGPIPTRS